MTVDTYAVIHQRCGTVLTTLDRYVLFGVGDDTLLSPDETRRVHIPYCPTCKRYVNIDTDDANIKKEDA